LSRFVAEQTLIKRLVTESTLPKLELDISDNNIPRAVEHIANWMEAYISILNPWSPAASRWICL
jgi:hypothetical protein